MAERKMQIPQIDIRVGVLYENEADNKSIKIRHLIPSRVKRIFSDGNCLFRFLSFVITGTEYNHKFVKELIIDKLKGEFREIISKYCSIRNDILPGGYCNSIEDYLKVSKMTYTGTWGTDQEIFLAALILKMDIFV